MRILVTGMDDFAHIRASKEDLAGDADITMINISGEDVPHILIENTARKIVEMIEAYKSEIESLFAEFDLEIVTAVLPVRDEETVDKFIALQESEDPDFVISFGQGAMINPLAKDVCPLSETGHTGFVFEPEFVNVLTHDLVEPNVSKPIDLSRDRSHVVSKAELVNEIVEGLRSDGVPEIDAYVNWDQVTGAGDHECNAVGYVSRGIFVHMPFYFDEHTRLQFWTETKNHVANLKREFSITVEDMPLMTTEKAYDLFLKVLGVVTRTYS